MSKRSINMNETVYEYLLENSLRENQVQKVLREETARLPDSSMQISPEQGQFFFLLMKLQNAKKTLDIGVFTGYSSLAVALALPDGGKVFACDIDPERMAMARSFWDKAGVSDKIESRIGPAVSTLDSLLKEGHAGSFDFAFLDADKTEYEAYYERCLDLLRPGGLIAVDNVLWSGSVADPGDNSPDTAAIREFNSKRLADGRIHLSMLPIGDGLTLALKK